jgi:BirA family biotin operon repressor/biotin-[acetyl-CoA-carboxylase] ligase
MTLTLLTLQTTLSPRPVRFYEQADSTNDLALAWLREGAAPGSVVITNEQVKGRGRMGRSWYTPPGTALILSVILQPRKEQVAQVTMIGALAVSDLLAQLGAGVVGIKWPNDVQLHGRKVCGILPEVVWDGDQLVGVVLGMGVNVRIDFTGTDLEQTAISIEPVLGKRLNRTELLANLLRNLDEWSARLGTTPVFDTWKSRLVTLGRAVTVQAVGGSIVGLAEDVDEHGALVVKDAQGQYHRVAAGDVLG